MAKQMSEGKVAPFIKEFYPEYYQWYEYPVEDCIPIRKTTEAWGILGNFAHTPLVVNGMIFDNSEQLFQMMKFTDMDALSALYKSKGLTLKRIAQNRENNGLRRPDWGRIIVDCMKFCLLTKYEQSESFRSTLEDTKGKIIVEDQTKFPRKTADTWGVKQVDDKFIGSNLLGRLLMELRDNQRLEYTLPDDLFRFISILTGKFDT